MGIDAGFDVVPRLSTGETDRQNWQSFIKTIKEHYQNDDLVEVKPNYIMFKAGEHPRLPFEGHKFLRFSSKISGSLAKGVEKYLDTVTMIAKVHFGSRVCYWNESLDERGFYNWQEVNDSFKSYKQADEPEMPTSELSLQLFDIQSVPGKGKSILARINIAKGQRILCEKPLFTTRNLSPISVMEGNVATKLKALSKTEQRQFLSLHNNFPGKYPFSGIVKTNALPCGPDSVIGGVYPTICLINHNCLPKAHNSWNSETECETIHAIRDIKSGEEITISYDKGSLSESRRAHLKDLFGFDCNCTLCALPPPELQVSDARRLQIQILDGAIGDPERVMNNPDDCLADCHLLLQVLKEEYEGEAGALFARLYYDAFQISITHGDQARASVFAERGYWSRVACEGEDNPVTQRIKKLMEDPTGHWNFEVSKRWQTAKRLVPKGLDADAFENWLWKRGR